MIAPVTIDDAMKGLPWQEVHDLREQRFADVHRGLRQPNPGTLPNRRRAVQIGDTLAVSEIPLFTGFATNHRVFNRTLLMAWNFSVYRPNVRVETRVLRSSTRRSRTRCYAATSTYSTWLDG